MDNIHAVSGIGDTTSHLPNAQVDNGYTNALQRDANHFPILKVNATSESGPEQSSSTSDFFSAFHLEMAAVSAVSRSGYEAAKPAIEAAQTAARKIGSNKIEQKTIQTDLDLLDKGQSPDGKPLTTLQTIAMHEKVFHMLESSANPGNFENSLAVSLLRHHAVDAGTQHLRLAANSYDALSFEQINRERFLLERDGKVTDPAEDLVGDRKMAFWDDQLATTEQRAVYAHLRVASVDLISGTMPGGNPLNYDRQSGKPVVDVQGTIPLDTKEALQQVAAAVNLHAVLFGDSPDTCFNAIVGNLISVIAANEKQK